MERRKIPRSVLPYGLKNPDMSGGQERTHRLSPEAMKHSFAVQQMEETHLGAAREFLCHCVRCKWTFQVSPDHGTIVAFNNVGEPLEGSEAEKRIATFASGPCPAFADFAEYDDARAPQKPRGLMHRLHPLLHLIGLDRAAQSQH